MKHGTPQRGQIYLTPIGTIRRIATQALPSGTSLFHQTLSARAFWDGEEVIRPIVRRVSQEAIMKLALPTQLFMYLFLFRVVFELLFYKMGGRRSGGEG